MLKVLEVFTTRENPLAPLSYFFKCVQKNLYIGSKIGVMAIDYFWFLSNKKASAIEKVSY